MYAKLFTQMSQNFMVMIIVVLRKTLPLKTSEFFVEAGSYANKNKMTKREPNQGK